MLRQHSTGGSSDVYTNRIRRTSLKLTCAQVFEKLVVERTPEGEWPGPVCAAAPRPALVCCAALFDHQILLYDDTPLRMSAIVDTLYKRAHLSLHTYVDSLLACSPYLPSSLYNTTKLSAVLTSNNVSLLIFFPSNPTDVYLLLNTTLLSV